jgi:hypothetical protein
MLKGEHYINYRELKTWQIELINTGQEKSGVKAVKKYFWEASPPSIPLPLTLPPPKVNNPVG